MSIIQPVVSPLAGGATSGGAFQGNGMAYDYALGGMGFLSAVDGDTAFERRTAPYRKEQQDTQPEPGEQSLVYWWMRSQQSFHGGSGRKFLEQSDREDQASRIQFESSSGIDVWTEGQATLLPTAPLLRAVTGTAPQVITVGTGADAVLFVADGATLHRVTQAGAATAVTWGGTGTILSLTTDGANYYAADATGIYRGTAAGGNGGLIWNTGSTPVSIGWVKQRLMGAIGTGVYELVGSGPTLPAAKYTSPQAVTWTNWSETPNSILLGYHDGAQSGVLQLTLNASGGVPSLTSAAVATTLPVGEQLFSLHAYLGRFLAYGTSRGVRVGVIDRETVTFGPRSYDCPAVSPRGVHGFTAEGTFLYFADGNSVSGQAAAWRLDLSRVLPDGRYPVASDLQAKVAGRAAGVALVNNRLAVTVAASGVYLQSTSPEASGTLTTARIRMSTLEPKLFKFLKLRFGSGAGRVTVEILDSTGAASAVVDKGLVSDVDRMELQLFIQPQEFIQLRITLLPESGASPTLRGYQVKALPAQKRQRLIVVPVLLYDVESDRHGTKHGKDGFAYTRLLALEELEEKSDIVQFQHLTADPAGRSSQLVVVDEVRFRQISPPGRCSGWGGRAEIILRSVT